MERPDYEDKAARPSISDKAVRTCYACKGEGKRMVRAGHCGDRLATCSVCKGTGELKR